MLPLELKNCRSILCLGAHSDDIEIGCGGTLIKLLGQNPGIEVQWVVFSAAGERGAEARSSAETLLREVKQKRIVLHEFRDTCFPYFGLEIKERFLQLQREAAPDLIFTHRRDDAHQDHRLLAELTWNSFRDHLILEYEIAKYEGDLGAPNFFVPLAESTAKQKIEHIMRHFPSQARRHWFTPATFEALMRLRSIECNAPGGMAEGFYCRKLTLG